MATFGDYLYAEAVKDIGSESDYGLPGLFCARAVKTWIDRAAAKMRVTPPDVGSDGALDEMHKFAAHGWWIDAKAIKDNPALLRAGMVAVWQRGEMGSGHGHTGVVRGYYGDRTFGTIEANAGPVVSNQTRAIDGTNFLGVGFFPADLRPAPPQPPPGPQPPAPPQPPPPPPKRGGSFGNAGGLLVLVAAVTILRDKPRGRKKKRKR